MAEGILVVLEQRKGQLKLQSMQALTLGRVLAGDLGGKLSALLIGSGVSGLAEQCKAYGADKIYVADDPGLEHYVNATYADIVAKAVKEADPQVIILPATVMGRELGPMSAARIGCGICTDITAVGVDGGALAIRKPIFAGKCFANFRSKSYPVMISIRPNVFAASEADSPGAGEVTALAVEASAADPKEVSLVESESGELDVAEASIIVSGGRGMKGPENFAILQELAAQLGAALGASRAVVDAGWIEHKHQVGQTGKTVSPNLYIAVGISGAIQHLAGMSSSKLIVAINKDPDAPIFQHCDFGIVGDLFKVLPELNEAIKEARS
ncbi:MAG TPA: electron transfer flavoprotein subunit alpha/FixB family protein [Acidobacteriota bacterium]|nr:electron transfer flavoprotein subunit alpha/FixB family protein [Acidobacteriota bacterium]